MAPLFFKPASISNDVSDISSNTTTTSPDQNESLSKSGSSSKSWNQPLLDDILKKAVKIKNAEIRWDMKVGLNDLFPNMFDDNETASGFSTSKTTCSYLINHGLAPRFRDVLVSEIKSSPYFSVSFDAPLNTALQKQQMDACK